MFLRGLVADKLALLTYFDRKWCLRNFSILSSIFRLGISQKIQQQIKESKILGEKTIFFDSAYETSEFVFWILSYKRECMCECVCVYVERGATSPRVRTRAHRSSATRRRSTKEKYRSSGNDLMHRYTACADTNAAIPPALTLSPFLSLSHRILSQAHRANDSTCSIQIMCLKNNFFAFEDRMFYRGFSICFSVLQIK